MLSLKHMPAIRRLELQVGPPRRYGGVEAKPDHLGLIARCKQLQTVTFLPAECRPGKLPDLQAPVHKDGQWNVRYKGNTWVPLVYKLFAKVPGIKIFVRRTGELSKVAKVPLSAPGVYIWRGATRIEEVGHWVVRWRREWQAFTRADGGVEMKLVEDTEEVVEIDRTWEKWFAYDQKIPVHENAGKPKALPSAPLRGSY